MPSQGFDPIPYTGGRHYVVYPDGAFTMPMTRRYAVSHARVFNGRVATHDPNFCERHREAIERIGRSVVFHLLLVVTMPVLGYYGTDLLAHWFIR